MFASIKTCAPTRGSEERVTDVPKSRRGCLQDGVGHAVVPQQLRTPAEEGECDRYAGEERDMHCELYVENCMYPEVALTTPSHPPLITVLPQSISVVEYYIVKMVPAPAFYVR